MFGVLPSSNYHVSEMLGELCGHGSVPLREAGNYLQHSWIPRAFVGLCCVSGREVLHEELPRRCFKAHTATGVAGYRYW